MPKPIWVTFLNKNVGGIGMKSSWLKCQFPPTHPGGRLRFENEEKRPMASMFFSGRCGVNRAFPLCVGRFMGRWFVPMRVWQCAMMAFRSLNNSRSPVTLEWFAPLGHRMARFRKAGNSEKTFLRLIKFNGPLIPILCWMDRMCVENVLRLYFLLSRRNVYV